MNPYTVGIPVFAAVVAVWVFLVFVGEDKS